MSSSILVAVLMASASNAAPFTQVEYTELLRQCERWEEPSCAELRRTCETVDVRGCYYLAVAHGLRGEDAVGLTLLRRACAMGMSAACRAVPEVEEYIREKAGAEKV